MEKDLDIRLVPKNKYRDAKNIEVLTSEGGDSGTVQSVKGNKIMTDLNTPTSPIINPLIVGSVKDESTKSIYYFVSSASDVEYNDTISGKTNFKGVRSDAIIRYTETTAENGSTEVIAVDCYESRHYPDSHAALNILSYTGVEETEVDLNGTTVYFPAGVNEGDRVQLMDINNNDLWSGLDIRVTSISSGLTPGSASFNVSDNSSTVYYNSTLKAQGAYIKITSERVLNFQNEYFTRREINNYNEFTHTPESLITAVNFKDGIIYWTDGETEPKRLIVDYAVIEDNASLQKQSFISEKFVSSGGNSGLHFLEEKHITVIKKSPKLAPSTRTYRSIREQQDTFSSVSSSTLLDKRISTTLFELPAVTPTTSLDEFAFHNGSAVDAIDTVYNLATYEGKESWLIGDTIILTGSKSASYVEVEIVGAYSGGFDGTPSAFNIYSMALRTIDGNYDTSRPLESWNAILAAEEYIYEDRALSFTTRYKYSDNTYSSIGPYSTPMFNPGFYQYTANDGTNAGMINYVNNFDVYDFIGNDLPSGVESVELLVKVSSSDNLHVIEEYKRGDLMFNTNGVHAKGLLNISKEVFGAVIPSNQVSRVYDAVPKVATAQELVGGRLMYGNYKAGFEFKDISEESIDPNMDLSFSRTANISTSVSLVNNNASATQQPDSSFLHTDPTSVNHFVLDAFGSGDLTYPNLAAGGVTDPQGNDGGFSGAVDFEGDQCYWFKNFPTLSNDDNVYFYHLGEINNMTVTTGGSTYSRYPWLGYLPLPLTNETLDNNTSWEQNQHSYLFKEDGTYTIAFDCEWLIRARASGDNHYRPGYRIFAVKVNEDANTNIPVPIIANSSLTGVDRLDIAGFTNEITQGTASAGGNGGMQAIFNPQNISTFNWDTNSLFMNITVGAGLAAEVGDRVMFVIGTVNSSNHGFGSNVNANYQRTGSPSGSDLQNVMVAAKNVNMNVVSSPNTQLTSITSLPVKSLKTSATYQTGVVYTDGYGRESTVLVSDNSKKVLDKSELPYGSSLVTTINHEAPSWAKYFKIYTKEVFPEYYNLAINRAYPEHGGNTAASASYVWLAANSSDINKVEVGSKISLKKKHNDQTIVSDSSTTWEVLAIQKQAEKYYDETDQTATSPEAVVRYKLGGVEISSLVNPSELEGMFFMKIRADLNYREWIDSSVAAAINSPSSNGAVFEVYREKDSLDLDLFYEISDTMPLDLYNDNHKIVLKKNARLVKNVSGLDAKITSVTAPINSTPISWNGITDDNYFAMVTVDNPVNCPPSISATNPWYVSLEFDNGNIIEVQIAGQNAGGHYKVIPYIHNTYYSNLNTTRFKGISNYYSTINFGNGVESDRIKDDFNKNTLLPYTTFGKASGYKASSVVTGVQEENKQNTVIFSEISNVENNIAGYNQFLIAENITRDVNPEYGSIQKLYARSGDLVVLCENKICRALADKDALYKADGTSDVVSSNAVLGQITPYAGDYGIGLNPESFAADENRIYFTDTFRGVVCRLSLDGITPISNYGMRDWFNDNLEQTQVAIGSWDTKKQQYHLTLHVVADNKFAEKYVYTISYSDLSKGWSSFQSFIQEGGISMRGEYYTFKKGNLYLHHPDLHEVNHANYYGNQYLPEVTLIFNDEPGVIKNFKTLNYEGSQAKTF